MNTKVCGWYLILFDILRTFIPPVNVRKLEVIERFNAGIGKLTQRQFYQQIPVFIPNMEN